MTRTLCLIALVILGGGLCPAVALAQPSVRLVAHTAGSARARPGPVQARVGEEVVLSVELVDGRRAEALPAGTVVRWLRIEPRLEHVALAPPNASTPSYSNSVLYGPHHGDWIGFDTIEYEECALTAEADVAIDGPRLRVRGAHAEDAQLDPLGAAGSIWIAAEVVFPGSSTLRTPAARDVDRLGLSTQVMRISFRESDDFIGWISTYEHVPDVFGSSGGRATSHQADRYVGADCMDLLMGAVRAMGRLDVTHASVSALAQLADPVSEVLVIGRDAVVRDLRGAPVVLTWGREVARGDLIALDYGDDAGNTLPRAWDHVGALVGDAADGSRGVFDPHDAYRNMTHAGVRDVALLRELPLRVRLWRWKPARSARRLRGNAAASSVVVPTIGTRGAAF